MLSVDKKALIIIFIKQVNHNLTIQLILRVAYIIKNQPRAKVEAQVFNAYINHGLIPLKKNRDGWW